METANEWNRGLKDSFDRFPELKKNFGFVGEAHERRTIIRDRVREFFETEWSRKYPNWNDKERKKDAWNQADGWIRSQIKISKNTSAINYAKIDHNIYRNMEGVSVNKEYGKSKTYFIESLKKDVESKHHPVGCDTIRSVLDHEVGHALDTLLGISKMSEVQKLIISLTNEQITTNLSRYSWKNGNSNPHREFIAEAWAEYCNNPNPRPIAKTIGELIESEYRKKFG